MQLNLHLLRDRLDHDENSQRLASEALPPLPELALCIACLLMCVLATLAAVNWFAGW